ncbi:MAG: HAD-IA family hydrolase [Kineosporiaceae bacterium]
MSETTTGAGGARGVVTGPLAGLIVDWGGVLTPPLDAAMVAWAQRDGVDLTHFRDVMRGWVGARRDAREALAGDADAAGTVPRGVVLPSRDATPAPGSDGVVARVEQADDGPAGSSPVHRLERGELPVGDFEALLAAELAGRGSTVEPEGLLRRVLGDLAELDVSMVGLVARAREAGLRTALLSNSWGNAYPDELMSGLFDAVVISGDVGMRKPELRIYRHTADLLGLPESACVMVDDLPHNVHAAAAAGMVGVLHRTYDETLGELEILFERSLR